MHQSHPWCECYLTIFAIGGNDFKDSGQPFLFEAIIVEFASIDQELFPNEIRPDLATGTSCLIIRLTATVDESETVRIERAVLEGDTGCQLSHNQLLDLGWKYHSATAQKRDLRDDRKSALGETLKAVNLGGEKKDFEVITTSLADTLSDTKMLKKLRK